MKKYFNSLKKLLKNSRYRALIILAFYVVFITVIVVAVRNSDRPVSQLDSVIEEYREWNNYNYTYNFVAKGEPVISMNGKRYNDHEMIKFNGVDYIFNNNILVGFPLSIIDVTKLRNDYIYDYIASATLKESTATFKLYELPLSMFMSFVSPYQVISDEVIKIMVISNNSHIIQIELDITPYANFNSYKYENYTVTINYTNVGNVLAF